MEKNILKKALTYLSGAVDYADDDGRGWREKIKKLCQEKGIAMTFLDPCDKPGEFPMEVAEEKKRTHELRRQGDWAGLTSHFKKIVRIDLRMVDMSEVIIVKIQRDIHLCGTYHELFSADKQKKPVLVIIDGGREECPGWLFGVVEPQYMFDDEESCVEYLDKVNRGVVETDGKWVLLHKVIEDSDANTVNV